ncbi:MAG: spermidine synthase [Elusimicrobia bacterium]|nr:spermidine synthase [Elusimicrobiota bacterium]
MSLPDLEILAYEPTPLGALCLRRRRLPSEPETAVTEVTLGGEFLMSSVNTASERALAETALKLHPGRELKVLVGGLGLGCTASAALASPRVKSLEAVELLPQVIAWLERRLVPLADELKADARFRAVQGDIFAMLARPPKRLWDLILIDVDHSPEERLDEASGPFYTAQGLARARRHLAPGGVLGVWSYSECAPFGEALRRTFAAVRVEPVPFKNRLAGTARTDWLYFGLS